MTDELFKKWIKATLSKPDANSYVKEMASRVYFDGPGVNSSLMKHTRPKEMEFAVRAEDEPTYAKTLGTLTHKSILEPNLFDMVDGDCEDWIFSPTKGLNTEKAKAARLANPDKLLITSEMLEKSRRLRDTIYANRFADSLLRVKRDCEVSGFAWNEDSQIIQKVRIDFYPTEANYLCDIKNCRSVETSDFWKTVRERKYHLSAALQIDTDALITGKKVRPLYYLIAVTGPTGESDGVKDAPYMAQVFEIATGDGEPSLVDEGRILYQDRLSVFANAARTNTWEAYENEPCVYLKAKPPWKL